MFGCKPSHPDKLGLGIWHGPLTLPLSGDVPLGPVVDQGNTNSCTGNAAAVAIQARMPRGPAGEWAPLPARRFLYRNAKALENDLEADDGAQLADVFAAAARVGFPRERDWPFSEAQILEPPSFTAYHAAADQRTLKGAYRILTIGSQRVAQIKSAIAAGHPVVLGLLLDQAFTGLGPTDVWPGVTGEIVGGHAMVAHRFDGDLCWLRSSWGPGYADDGSARIKMSVLGAAMDLWIVEMVPEYSLPEAA